MNVKMAILKFKTLKKYSLFAVLIPVFWFVIPQFLDNKSRDLDYILGVVSPTSFEIKVNTIGALDAARSHVVSSAIQGDKGKIIYIVDDGASVQKDDILVRLDPTLFEDELARLTGEMKARKIAVNAAKIAVERVKSEVENEIGKAEIDLKVSELEFKRLEHGEGPLQLSQSKNNMKKVKYEYTRHASYIKDLDDLEKKGYSNPTEIAQAKKKVEELRESYELAEGKYFSYRDYVLPSMIEAAKANVQKARMDLGQARKEGSLKEAEAMATLEGAKRALKMTKVSLERVQNELEKTVIRAPFSGIAVLFESFRNDQRRKPRVGDKVWRDQPILYLPDISSMIVKTHIREVDLHKITKGKPCIVKVDAYPDLMFKGEVLSLGVLATNRFGGYAAEKHFELTIRLKSVDHRLRPGMTARVSILIDQVENVLCVPVHAIFTESARKYCYVYNGFSFRKAEVSLGRQNEDMSEILSGLQNGDKVSLVKPSQ